MRIALFHNLPSGGAKRAVYEWTRRLAQSHYIDAYTINSADHDFCDIRPYVHQHKIFDFAPHRLFGSPFGRFNQLQRWRDLGRLIRVHKQIADEINAGEYQVVFANTCIVTFIPILVQHVRIPAIYYLHEPVGVSTDRQLQRPYFRDNRGRNFVDRYDPLIRLYRRRLASLQQKGICQADRLLANSTYTRVCMKTEYDIDTPVCKLGVDANEFQSLKGISKDNCVLSVGELSPRKGFDFILDSLGRIPADQRPVLRIISNSVIAQEREYLERLAVRMDVSVQIASQLSTEAMSIEYNRATLCVYAPVLEPFGLVPLEAMACGTPVVGVREGGVTDSIVHERTGLLIERDPAKFAMAIQYLLSNPSIRAEYGRSGREHVLQNWTWEQSVSALERHLLDCALGS
jgi:glycosyltransferase involved in cell wall biosynthesis